ncbi:helix-turn-helix domain-containing protein [Candidatus Synechococcus calcipolaris G9]|uniref:Helix-turn-helix domain-containing protein n=2 Tax=Synechococcus TaxID=1129 RepID=A0ABT6F2L3_9SYNE|nr:helix-turn-helix transcriptional regulator [Candidatus Synechococcus calcipolaris]MDG2992023.1 helix-turn-helix domain-containing protein [Candidatus Synechococcus calcipolaris G9]
MLRQKVSLSQEQLGELLGVTRQTISEWENGRSMPTLNPSEMQKLCHLLNCSLAELVEALENIKRIHQING